MPPDIRIPTSALVIPGFTELPDAIQAAIEELSKPFPMHDVKMRPGAVRRDGTAALCLAYGEWWTGYLPQLNDVIGPNNWSIDLEPWGADQIIARMTAFGGLIRKASTGSAKGETNGAAEAEAQAKKRVCAESVLLGLFFYFLPNVWGEGERVGKDFYFAEGEEQRCVYEMYARAGLLPRQYVGTAIEQPRPPTRQPFAEQDRSTGGSSQPVRAATPASSSAARAQRAPPTTGFIPTPSASRQHAQHWRRPSARSASHRESKSHWPPTHRSARSSCWCNRAQPATPRSTISACDLASRRSPRLTARPR